jgi:hypothetical protein
MFPERDFWPERDVSAFELFAIPLCGKCKDGVTA